MGWMHDYTFEHYQDRDFKKGQRSAFDKVLGFIKRNPDATVQDIREFTLKEKKDSI